MHASRMTDKGLAAFYGRDNVCCNEHRFEDSRSSSRATS
jgi:hypothetical protein